MQPPLSSSSGPLDSVPSPERGSSSPVGSIGLSIAQESPSTAHSSTEARFHELKAAAVLPEEPNISPASDSQAGDQVRMQAILRNLQEVGEFLDSAPLEDTAFIDELSDAFYIRDLTLRTTEEVVGEETEIGEAARQFLSGLARPLISILPEGYSPEQVGLDILAFNSYLTAGQQLYEGVYLVQARKLASKFEVMVASLKERYPESDRPQEVADQIQILEYQIKENRHQQKVSAVKLVANLPSDVGYAVRWTADAWGSSVRRVPKYAIWGWLIAVTLPQKIYAVYKIEKSVRREREWSQRLKKGLVTAKQEDVALKAFKVAIGDRLIALSDQGKLGEFVAVLREKLTPKQKRFLDS
jgi:hypothetical protein